MDFEEGEWGGEVGWSGSGDEEGEVVSKGGGGLVECCKSFAGVKSDLSFGL